MAWRLLPESLQNHNRFCKIPVDGFYPKSRNNQISTSVFVWQLQTEALQLLPLCHTWSCNGAVKALRSSNVQEAVEPIDHSST